MHLMTDTLRVSGRLLPGGPRNAIAFHGHQDANLRRPLATSTPTRPFEEPDRGEWVQTKSLAPYWGFFSNGHIAGHERKFRQDFKDIFSELYREFESRLVRQQVIDLT